MLVSVWIDQCPQLQDKSQAQLLSCAQCLHSLSWCCWIMGVLTSLWDVQSLLGVNVLHVGGVEVVRRRIVVGREVVESCSCEYFGFDFWCATEFRAMLKRA